jgi:hypothetical protein
VTYFPPEYATDLAEIDRLHRTHRERLIVKLLQDARIELLALTCGAFPDHRTDRVIDRIGRALDALK